MRQLQAKKATLVALAKAVPATSGAKAAACAELERVAASTAGSFSTPRGAVLPFGSMELAIEVGLRVRPYNIDTCMRLVY